LWVFARLTGTRAESQNVEPGCPRNRLYGKLKTRHARLTANFVRINVRLRFRTVCKNYEPKSEH
jgi:hypothetical protein